MAFTHLSVQSDFSFLVSSIRVEALATRIKELGMDACALTDHVNMFGAMPFMKACRKAGVKPILGARLFIVDELTVPGMRKDALGLSLEGRPVSRHGIYDVTVLVESLEGYSHLCKLITTSYAQGTQEKPLLTFQQLREHKQGLLVLSGTLRGEVASFLCSGEREEARRRVLQYREVFGDRYYLEAQSTGLSLQKDVNAALKQFSQELSIPVVATNDCHYLYADDAPAQEILVNVGRGRTIEDPDYVKLPSQEHFVKSPEAMAEAFSFAPEWVEQSALIAQRCHVQFKFHDDQGRVVYHLPAFEGEIAATSLIEQKAMEGLAQRPRKAAPHEEYVERIKFEINVINQMGFSGYFLIVADFIRWAKEHGIPVGPGRGSGAGSLVAYALGITGLDPIEHGLLFERFLNPERISMPDFDVDFCMDRREEVINYVRDKYGRDRVAQIITYGKMQAKAVVRDVARVFAVPHNEVDRFAKLIPNELKMTLEKALELEPKIREEMERDPRLKDVMDYSLKLEGLHRHAGIHAAGVIIADAPIVDYCPLYQTGEDDWMTQFDWISCEDIGLIKFDFLGLKTLTAIKKAEDWIRKREPEFTLDALPYDHDPKMFEMIGRGDTVGVFQLESSGMQDLCRKLQPSRFEELTAINALYRPGPLGSGMVDDFINRKKGTTPIIYDVPQLEAVLQETYGIIVYQEQVQRIAVDLASYTLGGADLLRRAMGKKKPEEMRRQREIFLEGARKNSVDGAKAEKIFNLMEVFAEYGFNKSHAAAYMMVAAQTGYLKAHRPVEFYASTLSTELSNAKQVAILIEDAKRHGIAVLPPDVNESAWEFEPVSAKEFRFGLGAIKGVGHGAVEEMRRAKEKGGPFKDLLDLIRRVDGRTVNKRTLEAFIKGGAFDFCHLPRARLMAALEEAIKQGDVLHRSKRESQAMLFIQEDWSAHHGSFWAQFEQIGEWESTQKLKLEYGVLGTYLSAHPLEKYVAKAQMLGAISLERLTQQALAEPSPAKRVEAQQQRRKTSNGKTVTVAGAVQGLRERRTKKGEKMAILRIEDLSGSCDVVVFPEAYRKFEAALHSGDPLLIVGDWGKSEISGQGQVTVGRDGRVESLEKLMPQGKAEVHITLETHVEPSKMLYVAEVLKRYPGSCPAFLHIVGEQGLTRMKLPEHLRVALSDQMVKELTDLCGTGTVVFQATGNV